MARKTTTVYSCDGCGVKVATVRELQRFQLVLCKRGRARDSYSNYVDLCDDCEARLLAAVEPIIGSDVVELRREEVLS